MQALGEWFTNQAGLSDSLDPAMPEKYVSDAPAATDAEPGDAG